MVNDRYRRGEIIGAGGMSEVYAAEDTVLGLSLIHISEPTRPY